MVHNYTENSMLSLCSNLSVPSWNWGKKFSSPTKFLLSSTSLIRVLMCFLGIGSSWFFLRLGVASSLREAGFLCTFTCCCQKKSEEVLEIVLEQTKGVNCSYAGNNKNDDRMGNVHLEVWLMLMTAPNQTIARTHLKSCSHAGHWRRLPATSSVVYGSKD